MTFLDKSLIYVVDPMCSWCWGFSPVFDELVRRYRDQVTIRLLLGGLRPGNTEQFDEHKRAYILSHWHAVHERTGQPFNFTFQMNPSFTYDTEPPSRAVVVVRQLAPEKELAFLHSVQEAFYVQNTDVTREETLSDLANVHGLDRVLFRKRFQDPASKQFVWTEFHQAREFGVSGFPALLGQYGQDLITFTHGYQPAGVVTPMIDTWLRRASS